MLKIRLRRTGKRNQPHYRVVVAEHTAPVTGKIVVSLGHFNPRTKELVLDSEEALRWMEQGAQPSNTVARLLLKHGLAHKALVVHTFAERPSKKAPKEPAEVISKASESSEAPAEKAVTETATEETAVEEVAPAVEETPAETTEPVTESETPKEETTSDAANDQAEESKSE